VFLAPGKAPLRKSKMATLAVINREGKETSKIDLPDEIFAVHVNQDVIHQAVVMYQACLRQGTVDTKERAEVSGGGKKPFRQKGTGRARQGTIRAPHHVGGGRVFGPHPRPYNMKINKKAKQLARRSALTYKARDEKIIIVEDFSYENPSTKNMKQFLNALNLNDKQVLFCTSGLSHNLVQSSTNLYNVQVRESAAFSTYDILRADTVVLQQGALDKVNEVLGK